MEDARLIRWRGLTINLDAILANDEEIWGETVESLTRCLLAYRDAQSAGGHDYVGWAIAGLQDDIERIAELIFPEEYRELREAEQRLEKIRRPSPAPDNRSIPRAVRKAVFERDDFRCVRCGARWDICVDHKHPASKGGESTLDNLQTLCRPCNSRKGNR